MHRFDHGQPPTPHPSPIVTARPIAVGQKGPAPYPVAPPALALVGPAALAGWHVELRYSRGTALLAAGKPGRPVEVVSVCGYRFPGERAAVTWERYSQVKGWEAGGGWLWSLGQRPRSVGVATAKAAMGGADVIEPTERTEPTRGACQVCGILTTLNKDGTVRVHGPRDDRCHGGRRVPSALSGSS